MVFANWIGILCFTVSIVLLIDLVQRYRRRMMGIPDIYSFKGLLNFPTVACIGFVIAVFSSWSGWLLGIISAIAVTEEVKVLQIDRAGSKSADFFNNVFLRLLIGLFIISELLAIGCLFQFVLRKFTTQ